ncbi:hypothetical protein G5714_018016 [Onychostoma macrolepis]|uniref:C2H2-type domain-containing protein n=1 Tax=Onychostoma macrolepis TaxID=369639 RepID=A0A7J6C3M5_9TELE|nr:hypothetical protein G5714_018016 [Onychostoma macrolepis]
MAAIVRAAKHLKHAIYFEDNGIQKYCIPCFCLKSQQRKRCHWHCPKCQHILCRAPDLKKHLHNHDFAVMDKVPNKPEEGPTENPKARQHVRQEQPPVICIDKRNGVFVTPKDVHGPRVPIHVKKHIVSASVACESPLCRDFMRIGVESGNPGMECDHLQRTNRAVCYSAPPALREDSLQSMTDPNAGDSDVDERVRDVAETEVAALASTDIQDWTDYLWSRKRVPEDLPEDLSTKERQIPDLFEPLESNCPYCPGPTPPAPGERVLITRRGTVYGVSSVTRGVPVYVRNCLVCRRLVRFQEYQSGFHNYDNRTFLTIPLFPSDIWTRS